MTKDLTVIVNHPLYASVSEQLVAMLDKQPPKTLVVAVSGGADSMALTLLAHSWSQAHGWTCRAVTVDHRLRKESTVESQQVAMWLEAYGISHTTLTWEGEKPTHNIQAAAREERYNLLSEYCHEQKAEYLLLAHHCGDQAETLLMRMLRGSGLRGLCGMASVSRRYDVTLFRPLLHIDKSVLTSFLQDMGQPWVEDPSNDKEDYDRVWIRKLLATHRDADVMSTRLSHTAQRLQTTWDYVSQQVTKEWRAHIHVSDMGYVSFSREWFVTAHPEVQYQCLSEAFRLVSGEVVAPRSDNVAIMLQALQAEAPFRRTLHGCLLSARNREVFISKEPHVVSGVVPVTGTSVQWDRWQLQLSPSAVMRYQDADIRALGEDGVQYIRTHAPELIKKTLPKAILYTIPAIWRLEKVVAVPHIGYDAGMEKNDLQYNFIPKGRFCL
jgi:tRNA(Ile)-lysidine synthase